MELKNELFSSIEGNDIDINIKSEHMQIMLSFPDVLIDSNESICSSDNELHIDWNKTNIIKSGDIFIIELPEATYEIMIV